MTSLYLNLNFLFLKIKTLWNPGHAECSGFLSSKMHFFFSFPSFLSLSLFFLFSLSLSSMFFKKHLFRCLGSCLQHAASSLHHMGFFTVVHRPELRGSAVVSSGLSCCTQCELLVPRPRFEPTSPAFQGRFFFL